MPTSQRLKAVEAVKGIAIVLMVYGHVAQGLNHRGWWATPNYFFQQRFIYTFHMAAFFFVSGLFVSGSIAKSGAGQFVVQRLRTILWPYVFCVAGYGASLAFGRSAQAGPRDLTHSILIPMLTGEASWFLPTLFICLLLALLTHRLPNWAGFAAAAALSLLWPATGIRVVDSAAHYFVFMAAGEWVNRRVERVPSIPRWAGAAGAIAAFASVAAGTFLFPVEPRVMAILLGLAGILGLFLLSAALRDTWFDSAAVWCGAASLGIFVLHPLFQGTTRLLLAHATASHAVLLNVGVPTVVAVLGPAVLWHFREPLHIGFLFVFPWGAPRQASAPRVRENAVLAKPIASD